jgi:hypothetical protein
LIIRPFLLGAAFLIILLSSALSCESATREGGTLGTTKEEIKRRLDEKLRKGVTPNEVLAVLNQLKVDHSDYLNRPVIDPDLVAQLDQVNAGGPTYLNTRRIQAIVRDVKRNFPVSESIQIIFLFDEYDKFVKYELRSIFTGP